MTINNEVNLMPIASILADNYAYNLCCMTEKQLGKKQYKQWDTIMHSLYIRGRQIYNSKEWASLDELRRLPAYITIYEKLQEAIDMIGSVNGYQLRKDSNWGVLVAAYSHITSKDKQTIGADSIADETIFKMRIEHFLAREIILQRAKTPAMLADEKQDSRLISRMRRHAKRISETVDDYEQGSVITTEHKNTPTIKNIDFNSFMVKCNSFKCNKNHNIDNIRAVVDVMMPSGLVMSEEIAAGYCKECDVYFLLETDYMELRNQGVLLCQLVDRKTYEINGHIVLNGNVLKSESLLRQSGYTVSAAENLSTIQRQEILKRVIDNDLYSKTAVLSFLDWLISRSEKTQKKDMHPAIQKWRADRTFIANYKLKDQHQVNVHKIVR